MVWDKAEGLGAVALVARPSPKPDGFGPNQPGPSGFRPAGARGVGLLGRTTGTTCTTLLADRHAET